MDREAKMVGEKQKLEFFRELEKLDEISDDEDHTCNLHYTSTNAEEKPSHALTKASDILVPASPDCVFVEARAAPKPNTGFGSSAVVVKETPYPPLSKTVTGNVNNQIENSPSIRPDTSKDRKRKGSAAVKKLPESQQVFKGLVFFFVPNNNISPARRMRINKALEFGATWASTWQDQITHVIVDKELSFEDVMGYLKLKSFPPSIALVNDTYTADCIRFRSIVDVSHSRFQVRGAQPFPESRKGRISPKPSFNSSLVLKRPGKKGTSAIATPPRVQEDGEFSLYDSEVTANEMNHEADPDSRNGDPLRDLIEEVKGAEILPLESEGDESPGTTSDSDSARGPKRKRVGAKANPLWQQSFTCMQKHDGNLAQNNPNSRTISILEQMLEHYERTSDQWRTIAYRKAISALRREKEKIVSKDQALRIPCIGERLASKIEEIVWTNRLRRLEYAYLEPNDKILQMFLNIYGVGFSQASKWIAQGHRSLEDLTTKVDLTNNQKIGIERYEDFLQRIPRAEVEAHGEVVRRSIRKVDPDIRAIIAGSYRRGAANSGDIDMLITKPGASLEEIRSLMMDVVVPDLFHQEFLKSSLAISSRSDGSKWHGASALPGNPVWRRIDLLFVPWHEIGAALIYFTGNDIFNRSLRLLASKRGMCLNQRGLFEDVLRGSNRVKMNSGRLLEGHNEKRIFELLGVPWRPPEHRIC